MMNSLTLSIQTTAIAKIRLLKTKEALHVAEDERLKGINIRSKEDWLEFGEKLTKYILQLERKIKKCYQLTAYQHVQCDD